MSWKSLTAILCVTKVRCNAVFFFFMMLFVNKYFKRTSLNIVQEAMLFDFMQDARFDAKLQILGNKLDVNLGEY